MFVTNKPTDSVQSGSTRPKKPRRLPPYMQHLKALSIISKKVSLNLDIQITVVNEEVGSRYTLCLGEKCVLIDSILAVTKSDISMAELAGDSLTTVDISETDAGVEVMDILIGGELRCFLDQLGINHSSGIGDKPSRVLGSVLINQS